MRAARMSRIAQTELSNTVAEFWNGKGILYYLEEWLRQDYPVLKVIFKMVLRWHYSIFSHLKIRKVLKPEKSTWVTYLALHIRIKLSLFLIQCCIRFWLLLLMSLQIFIHLIQVKTSASDSVAIYETTSWLDEFSINLVTDFTQSLFPFRPRNWNLTWTLMNFPG